MIDVQSLRKLKGYGGYVLLVNGEVARVIGIDEIDIPEIGDAFVQLQTSLDEPEMSVVATDIVKIIATRDAMFEAFAAKEKRVKRFLKKALGLL